MKLFSLFHSHQLAPAWTYAGHGVIWRLIFSTTGKIVGECRDNERKQASFFCLNEQTGKVQWDDRTLAEPWWVGIEAIHANYLILHEFAKPDLPEHNRIRALDLESGNILWQNDELTFWFAHRDTIYAYRDTFERRAAYALALQTGEITASYEDTIDELNGLRKIAMGEQESNAFLLPQIFEEEALQPAFEKALNKEIKGKSITGNIEFIQEQEYLLMNYHLPAARSTPEAPMFENHFSILEGERGGKVFSDVLTSDAKTPMPDSFFIKRPFVYFVKDQTTLTAVRLWK